MSSSEAYAIAISDLSKYRPADDQQIAFEQARANRTTVLFTVAAIMSFVGSLVSMAAYSNAIATVVLLFLATPCAAAISISASAANDIRAARALLTDDKKLWVARLLAQYPEVANIVRGWMTTQPTLRQAELAKLEAFASPVAAADADGALLKALEPPIDRASAAS